MDTSTLTDAIALFLQSVQSETATARTYATGLGAFGHFVLESEGRPATELPLTALKDSVLEDFQRYLTEREYSRFTVRTYSAALSALLNYLLVHDLLPPTFSMAKAHARARRSTRRAPYPAPVPDPALPLIIRYYDELPLLMGNEREEHLANLRTLRSRAIVHTLYASAGRIAEVTSLSRRDVADGRQSQVVITGKGNKQRFIYLTPEAQAAITRYVRARHDTHQPLFISHGREYGARLSKVSVWATVKAAARALDIDVSPHDFRHYRARQMLEQGAPLEAIQEILGHSDISTTRKVYAIYSHHAVRDIFDAATLSASEAIRNLGDER
ncbi:MAG: tyrosine-type recombinase/integrase [Anaerolineae bacterium]